MKTYKGLQPVGLIALVVLLSACVSAEKKMQDAGYSQMSDEEIQADFQRDRATTWVNASGGRGTATYRADGGIHVEWGSG